MGKLSNKASPSTRGPNADAARRSRIVLSEAEWGAVAGGLGLSDRELQIVRCIFDDRKEQAIAARLGISANTVRTHLVRVYGKLGVHSRNQLSLRVMAAARTPGDRRAGTD